MGQLFMKKIHLQPFLENC